MYEYWFAKIQGITAKNKRRLREYYGEGKVIYNIVETKKSLPGFMGEKEQNILVQSVKDAKIYEEYKKLKEDNIFFVPYYSEKYPSKLKNISAPPYALYVKGRLPEEERASVAIVGARGCTQYGEHFALEYGKELARAGVNIISGMARGIDGAGHRGALNVGGNTFAVLGCGPDICYPLENKGLYDDIQKQGGIISEYPPGTMPLSRHFPARNRIISGLSDVVLVLEAKEKSGSLITADMALEQGKDVYALPGMVTSALSQGCHQLISQGAGILISPSELLKQLEISHAILERKTDKQEKELERDENMVYSCLDLYPKSFQTIVSETGFLPKKVIAELVELELDGKVKEISKNYYVKI